MNQQPCEPMVKAHASGRILLPYATLQAFKHLLISFYMFLGAQIAPKILNRSNYLETE